MATLERHQVPHRQASFGQHPLRVSCALQFNVALRHQNTCPMLSSSAVKTSHAEHYSASARHAHTHKQPARMQCITYGLPTIPLLLARTTVQCCTAPTRCHSCASRATWCIVLSCCFHEVTVLLLTTRNRQAAVPNYLAAQTATTARARNTAAHACKMCKQASKDRCCCCSSSCHMSALTRCCEAIKPAADDAAETKPVGL